MTFIVNEEVERYAHEHTTPDQQIFRRLEEETRAISDWPQMMVGPLEGQLLGWLVWLSGAQRVLEIGTFTGYSSISMALNLAAGGRITSLDVNEETTAVARRYAEEAGVADRIDYRVGPALEALESLDGPFDLVFIDADKESYVNYYEAVLPKLAERGLHRRRQRPLVRPCRGGRRGREHPGDQGVQPARRFGRARRVLDADRQGRDDPDSTTSGLSFHNDSRTTSACESASSGGG